MSWLTGTPNARAAAMVASGMQPAELQFVSLDERQSRAAEREGFPILV